MNRRLYILCLTLAVVTAAFSASTAWSAAIKMPSGFYYPTERTWTGTSGGSVGDPKQPWNDGSPGGRIYGFMDPTAPQYLGKNHVGMDIRTPYSSPVYAIAAGTIERYMNSGDSRYWCLIVKHRIANGSYFWAVYGHCRIKSGYSVGRSIAAGENFAYINESGNQHIHFGIKMNSNFSTGWGHLSLGTNADSIGWRGPRTWLSANTPYGSTTDTGGPVADTTAPSITITGPTVDATQNVQYISWNVADSGSGVNTVTLQWNSGTATTVTAIGRAQIPDAQSTLTIRATDKAGNAAMKTGGPYTTSNTGLVVTVDTGVFADGFYVQQLDGVEGLHLKYGSSGGPNLASGDLILLTSSQKTTVNGEQVLTNATVTTQGATNPAEPIKVSVPDLKVESVDVGLLVTVTGKVTYLKSDGTAFYVDDGTAVYDGYHTGIRVVCNGFTDGSMIPLPPFGSTVTVVGIHSRANVLGKIVPCIRLRGDEDII